MAGPLPPTYFRARPWEPAWCSNCGNHYVGHKLPKPDADGLIRGRISGPCLVRRRVGVA